MYKRLKKYNKLVPLNVLNSLEINYMNIVKHNMLLTSELIKIMRLFEKNEIKAVSFKGPTLSQFAYGDVTLRQYVDLDILINEADLEKIQYILEKADYFSENILINKKLKIEVSKDMSYFNSKKNVSLEIHWRLFSFTNNYRSNYEYTFLDFNNIKLLNFDINFYIVYLSIHGSRHLWERLEWIVDINKIIHKYNREINFNKIYEIASLFDNIKSINLALFLCYKLFNNPFIKNTFEQDIIFLSDEILKRIDTKERASNLQVFIFHCRLFSRIKFKIGHLFGLFKVNERDLLFINSKYKFMYLISKPVRLLIELFK